MVNSRTKTLLAAAAGMALGAATSAALGAGAVVTLSGRSRPAIEGLEELRVPAGLPPARVEYVPLRGEMFFRDQPGPSPDAPTVVLVHGWIVSADLNWFTSYGPLSQVARVIAPDHRGHGRGTRHSQPYRLEDVADDIAALLRTLDTGPAIIVGFSMGGPITQLLWQRHPDLVAGVVMCATASNFRYGPIGGAHWRLMALYQVGLRLLPRAWMERALLAQISGTAPVRLIRTVGEEVSEIRPLLPWVVGEVERGDVEDLAEAGRELGRFDSRSWLGAMDRPSAVIVTTQDRLIPPTTQLELASLLPDVMVSEVEGDHDAPAAVPGAFNAALLKSVQHIVDRM